MRRRALEQEKVKKDTNPNSLLQDGSLVARDENAQYHVELDSKVILIKRPAVDHLTSGVQIKTEINGVA